MANYNYTTNCLEEAGLALAVAALNAQPNSGNPPNPPSWTNQDYVAQMIEEDLSNAALANQAALFTQALTNYASASSDNQGLVLGLLGFSYLSTLSVDNQIAQLTLTGLPAFLRLSRADQVSLFGYLGFSA